MPTFERFAVEVRLYDEGQADPVLADHGAGWWDNLGQTAKFGSISRGATGEPQLEYLSEVGLTCRPALTYQDTRLSQFALGTGTWSEVRPASGAGRKYRLLQSDSTANLAWSATSTYWLPADPHVAFSLLAADTPPDQDVATYPPFVRLELGVQGGVPGWAIEISSTTGNRLLQYVLGAWRAVLDLPPLDESPDLGEGLIWVRVVREQIGISMDRGRSYTWHQTYDGSGYSIRSGAWTLRGQGGVALAGLHQLAYSAGTYASPGRTGFAARFAPPSIAFSGRYDTPGSTSVAFADAATHSAGTLAYTATLTPDTLAGTPFTFHRTPALYAVTYRIPTIGTLAAQSYTTPWDGQIVAVDLDKPLDLGTSSCTLRLRRAANLPWSGTYRNRKLQVRIGRRYDDGSTTWQTVFTGYIVRTAPMQASPGALEVQIDAANVSHRYRRTRWAPDYEVPLGGQTLGEALDQILETEGTPRNSSYRIWAYPGAAFPLPAGRPENPTLLTRRGEEKWQTLTTLAGLAQQELAVSDTGVLQTVPLGYYSGTVHEYRLSGTADLNHLAEALHRPIDYRETVTAIYGVGESEWGGEVLAGTADAYAELDVSSGRFCPWREAVVEQVPGTVTPGLLASRVQGLAREHFGLKVDADLGAVLNADLARRDQLEIYGGAALGIVDGTRFTILALRHQFRVAADGAVTYQTQVGVRMP